MQILLLTSVFRDENLGTKDKSTDVVNKFAYSWATLGHKVLVIHNVHRYPFIVHAVPHAIKEMFAAKRGFQLSDFSAVREKHYTDKDVDVWKMPIKKFIPHGSPSKRAIDKQIEKIKKVLRLTSFSPDVVIGHWASPQMEIINGLLDDIKCPSAITLHGTEYISNPVFPTKHYLKHIDKLGCRSVYQANSVQELLNLEEKPFVCYSGISEKYLDKYEFNSKKFDNVTVWKFVYAGRLVEYKKIDLVIRALSKIPSAQWVFDIIGEGADEKRLKRIAKDSNCSDKVHFRGKLSRDEVMNVMSEAQCFVMVSKGEIFGLVYLEAMAASCITIGAQNEGIDGVIFDHKNGFLCETDSIEAICTKMEEIMSMNTYQLKDIAEKGYITAHEFSDLNVSKSYLSTVLERKDIDRKVISD